MLVDGHPVHLYVQLAAAGNSTTIAQTLDNLPQYSVLWLRKGRQSFTDECAAKGTCYYPPEVRYAALWLRERFWRATMMRRKRQAVTSQHTIGTTADGGPILICVHVRRGDVYYLGPKTQRPHPHWVETTTVLDMLIGVRRALQQPLALPAVVVEVFSEKGWMKNDTTALQAIAPDAKIHIDSSPSATVDALIQMSRADLLVMGSSGFSFWAGVFGCGVKIGEQRAESLPMRHVGYASTLTTRTAPFWPSAGATLKREWARYWSCRVDPVCRPNLCAAGHLWAGSTKVPRAVWTESKLARQQLHTADAVQWRLPELILWPEANSARHNGTRHIGSLHHSHESMRTVGQMDGIAMYEMRHACMNLQEAKNVSRRTKRITSAGLVPCVRNRWLHNLTTWLAGRRSIPGACC